VSIKKQFLKRKPVCKVTFRVRDLFSREGTVHSIKLINNRETAKPRGFGFVKMEHNEAISAIRAFNGTEFGGRPLQVNEARERGAR
jgi:RNA recognition motif-containing protein